MKVNYMNIFPVLGIFGVWGILFSIMTVLKLSYRKKEKRSPFTDGFFRSPGESLNEKIFGINEEITIYLTNLFVFPFMIYSMVLSDLYFRKLPLSISPVLPVIIIGLSIMGFFLYKLVQLVKLRTVTRLGYEGEVAVGQELNHMMRQGYYVYHDFVADDFNIDHVVVGPAGVFAVETKARSKSAAKESRGDVKVYYDETAIKFPTWIETQPIVQAKNQAAWLEKWLASSAGERVMVTPVVALPGWYVTRTSPKGIPVINPKQFPSLAKPVNGRQLSEAQIKRIVYQIDQRCRNIKPKSVK